jgi:dual-specificity kinase
MSTPSTATATLPPHHQFYPHHQAYQPSAANPQLANGSARIGNSLYNGYASGSNSEMRRTATAHTRQPLPPIQTHAPAAPDMSMSAPESAQRRRNITDWNDFYKNGLPKEVIVIDDDDEDPPPPALPQPDVVRTATTTVARHADKKRKTTAATAYDPVYNQQPSYSTTQTPYAYESPNQSRSTDRTTSALNTTAATSLGSQVSNGHHLSPLDSSAVGQKRKRTRAVAQDEAKQTKRRELDHDDNPFSLYQPPPNPVIKAKDVYVTVVPDVGQPSGRTASHANTSQKSYTKDQKVDDEDGHYIVVPDADLTERCACPDTNSWRC